MHSHAIPTPQCYRIQFGVNLPPLNLQILARHRTSSDTDQNKKKLNREGIGQLRRIAPYLAAFKGRLLLGVLMISMGGALTLAVTRLWGRLGGVGLVPGSEKTSEAPFGLPLDTPLSIGLAIGSVLVFQASMGFFRIWLFGDMTTKLLKALRGDTFKAMLSQPMTFFDERRVGELNSRIAADITTIKDTFTVTLAELIRQLIIIIGGLTALVLFSWRLTLLMLITLPVGMFATMAFGRFIRKLAKETQEAVSDSNVIVSETLTGIQSVKSFAREAFEVGRYGERIEEIRKIALRTAVWRGGFVSFIIIVIFGAITIVLIEGSRMLQSGELDAENFFSFLLMTGLVAGSIGGIANVFSSLQTGLGAIEEVMDLIERKGEPILLAGADGGDADAAAVAAAAAASSAPPLEGRIAWEGVSFHYPHRADVEVLHGIDLAIEPGETVALVGGSGAGKSTLAALVPGFYPASTGQVKIDGKPLAEHDLTALRSRMAIVPQEVILFGGSIRDNIGYGRLGASEDEIAEAARQAMAWEFIDGFPEGFDTLVGERGVQLSGGQRQRIAIARAFLAGPDILILDEATSALDAVSERAVQIALDRLMEGRTSLIIAHRLSTVRAADRIIVLEAGSIVEQGDHMTLMAAGGRYCELVEHQLQDANGSGSGPESGTKLA